MTGRMSGERLLARILAVLVVLFAALALVLTLTSDHRMAAGDVGVDGRNGHHASELGWHEINAMPDVLGVRGRNDPVERRANELSPLVWALVVVSVRVAPAGMFERVVRPWTIRWSRRGRLSTSACRAPPCFPSAVL